MEDLRAIGDTSVCTKILKLVTSELRVPSGTGPLDGRIDGMGREVWWRRAIPLASEAEFTRFDLKDESDPSWDYVIVYRHVSHDECINYKLRLYTYMVVRVVSNDALLSHIAGRWGQLWMLA